MAVAKLGRSNRRRDTRATSHPSSFLLSRSSRSPLLHHLPFLTTRSRKVSIQALSFSSNAPFPASCPHARISVVKRASRVSAQALSGRSRPNAAPSSTAYLQLLDVGASHVWTCSTANFLLIPFSTTLKLASRCLRIESVSARP